MRAEQQPETALMPRLLAALAGFGFRRPWLVLAITTVSCAVAVWYTAENLTYLTHRNDLIGKNKDYYKRWDQYVREFGDDDDMVVVVRGPDRAHIVEALEHLAREIEKQPELFDRLVYKAALRSLGKPALML